MPEIDNVILGCVKVIGAVVTFATGARDAFAGRATVKGRAGIVA